jgi:hypothetical protein
MPDFGDLEQEAKSHSKQVDKSIEVAQKKADEEVDGRDHGIVDKAANAAEKELGGEQGNATQPTP